MIKRARRQAIWTGVLPGHRRDGSQHLKDGERENERDKRWRGDYLIMMQALSYHSNFSLISVDFCCRHQGKLKQWKFREFLKWIQMHKEEKTTCRKRLWGDWRTCCPLENVFETQCKFHAILYLCQLLHTFCNLTITLHISWSLLILCIQLVKWMT